MDSQQLLYGETTWEEIGLSAANTAQDVTHAASTAGIRHVLTGLTISFDGEPAAAVLVEIKDGASVRDAFYLPAAKQVPFVIEYRHKLRTTPNVALTVTVAAAGAGIKSKVSMRGFSGR